MAFKRSSIANAITFSVSLSVYRPLYRRARFLLLYLNGLGGLARLVVEFVGVRDGENVLDVGCGTGSLSATLTRVTRARRLSASDPYDLSIDWAARARAMVRARG